MPKHFYPLRELHKFASKIVWALLCAVLALFAFELANHPSYTDRDFRIVERVTDGSTLVIEVVEDSLELIVFAVFHQLNNNGSLNPIKEFTHNSCR